LAGGLGLGRELLLEDLELLLLSGKTRALVRLEPVDLLAECGNLRGRLGSLVGDGRRSRRLEEELPGQRGILSRHLFAVGRLEHVVANVDHDVVDAHAFGRNMA
jgi:hypothetical protein